MIGGVQFYWSLGVVVADTLLLEQAGIVIDDHVNRPCRVTVESVIPEEGFELDARSRLGEKIKLTVVLVNHGKVERELFTVEGKIIAFRVEQDPPREGSAPPSFPRVYFTVEQDRIAPEDNA